MVRQLIYRREFAEPPASSEAEDGFILCDGIVAGLAIWPALRKHLGWGGGVKVLAKLTTATRQFYGIMRHGEIVSHGHVAISFCRHYPVDPGSVVIGPVWTRPDSRGQGLATRGVNGAMRAMFRRGRRVFYIDTSETNIPMQRVIARCGFGDPVSQYERNE